MILMLEMHIRVRPKCRWENNIELDLREIGLEVVDWIHLAQDRSQ
jgi:hypothetical protein